LSHKVQDLKNISINPSAMPPFMTIPSHGKPSSSSKRSEKVFPVHAPDTHDKSKTPEEVHKSEQDFISYITVNGKKFEVKDAEWKTMAPTNNIYVIKQDGKTWRWCVSCQKWMFHDITKHDFWAVRNLR
jgi:hypothetical protein